MEKFETVRVFTPTTPARFTFIERDALNQQLVDAIRTPGKQVVVYGPSGSGKSTLLVNKLEQLYPDHITSRCTAATTFEALLLGAFDSLNCYYSTTASVKKSNAVSFRLEQDYLSIKSSIEASTARETSVTLSRLIPPQLTSQRLAEFCGAANCCWVLEDFHKVPVAEKTKLSQIMKVFTDAASDYPNSKIIAIGAVNTAREVIQYDPEMRNRVAEIAVPLMGVEELLAIVEKGEELLNVQFGALKNNVASYASGLAAVCHQLCLNICFAASIHETSKTQIAIEEGQLQTAVERYLSDASDTLKAVFDLATRQKRVRRFDNTRIILSALTQFGGAGGTYAQILSKIREQEPEYPSGNLTIYLAELQSSARGEIVRLEPASGRYFFSDPLYLAYSQCKLRQAPRKPNLQLKFELNPELIQKLNESLLGFLTKRT